MPVLRAGLGMAEAAFNLLPESQMGFVGLARNEETHQPEAYMASLPDDLAGRSVLVLDPMLATGGSLIHCCQLLASRGAADITVDLRPRRSGRNRRGRRQWPGRQLYTASIDSGLNSNAYIVPGLGGRRRSAVRPALKSHILIESAFTTGRTAVNRPLGEITYWLNVSQLRRLRSRSTIADSS